MDSSRKRPADQDRSGGDKRARYEDNARGRGGSKGRGARGSRNKRGDMGRKEWSRNSVDKRTKIERGHQDAERRKVEGTEKALPIYTTQFSKEELDAEIKKPKRKVAVMIGYAGTGYKGLQLSHREKTIEGDLFKAFVGAGAVSKANADDPKKVSLVRCARTDKGVHAAGNLLSLKLIVEDANIVEKINQHLSPQIRVFSIERTNAAFSAYHFCNSRIYEYLIPTHCFLPPHTDSYLGRKLDELAKEANDTESYRERQSEVSSFWAKVEEAYIKPVLDNVDASIKPLVQKALYEIKLREAEEEYALLRGDQDIVRESSPSGIQNNSGIALDSLANVDDNNIKPAQAMFSGTEGDSTSPGLAIEQNSSEPQHKGTSQTKHASEEATIKEPSPLEIAIRQLKAAYIIAKKAYRIDPRRLQRVRSTLSRFNGTHSFHNYTIDKSPRDPSAKRVIKSFVVAADPIIINDAEWLSLKVHGQSFMMHQIRKMVSMAALIVRCGCHEGRIQDSYLPQRLNVPKAPSLGLLLERPVFDAYNEKLVGFGREAIDFDKFEKEISEFKQREIYERIFREEEQHDQFHSFFGALDNLKNSSLLYLSSMGVEAVKREDIPMSKSEGAKEAALDGNSSDEAISGFEDG